MSTISSDELSDVWGRVCRWPEPLRISLASRILQSLDHERAEQRPKKTLADLVGLLVTAQPPPTDEDVERILEEERMKKYG